MKTLSLLAFFCFISFGVYSKNKNGNKGGVFFFNGSWAELIKTARTAGKPIFVDVYTDWCPPCKRMDKEVIPQQTVGDKYNQSFISYKLNAEKGEGIEIAKRYEVGAYPTYLYLDAQGNLLHRAVGFFEAPAFIANADKALLLGSAQSTIGNLDEQFKSGQKDPDFLHLYIQKRAALGLDNSEALNAYLELTPLSKLNSSSELVFLGTNIRNANSRAMIFLMANFSRLNEVQKKSLAPKLGDRFASAMDDALKEGKPIAIMQSLIYLEMIQNYLSDTQIKQITRRKLFYYGMVKDTLQLKKTGYSLANSLMNIPLDSIRAEDNRRYMEIMKPIFSGTTDSTKIEGFQEEKKYIINIYSREIASYLYDASKAFLILDTGDPALKDALVWAKRMNVIVPQNKPMEEILDKLSKKCASGL